jgi:beta-carotene hydroxylase
MTPTLSPKSGRTFRLPGLDEIGAGLLLVSRPRLVVSLLLPFFWFGAYFLFAALGYWPIAVFCLVSLSFVTYGSVSHDLVHGSLGLKRRMNSVLLTVIELLALRSGHAYRLAHLHHHARFPHHDDIEGRAAGMTMSRTLLEGLIFVPKIWLWALRNANRGRWLVLVEGIGCLWLILFAVAMYPVTPVFLVYVLLMVMGSWIIPLVTSYVPHAPHGADALHQTRRFRGEVASLIALEHLYHLEHHLYPAVPHHNWPMLARRLDPYLDAAGVAPVKFWF